MAITKRGLMVSGVVMLLLIALLSVHLYVTAQTPANDNEVFFAMLENVPAEYSASPFHIFYTDIELATRTRNIAIDSIADWENRSDFAQRNWLASVPSTLPQNFYPLFNRADEVSETTGVDLFSINQVVWDETGPEYTLLMTGDFDVETVTSAYETRDYAVVDDAPLSLLCPADGCDQTIEANPDNYDPTNLFGGFRGLSQLVAVSDTIFYTTPLEDVANDLLATYGDETPSLLDAPSYNALAHAMAEDGQVRVAHFVLNTDAFVDLILGDEEGDSNRSESIPAFEQIAFADTISEDDNIQRGTLYLLYDNEADATTATEVVMERLSAEDATSLAPSRASYAVVFARRDLTLVDGAIFADDTGDYYVARIHLETSLVDYGTVLSLDGTRTIVT
ncbi:MAG: hypothetical protein AAFQ52_14475, partial [Chloroflexota bacterium]